LADAFAMASSRPQAGGAIPTPSTMMEHPRANPAAEAKSADVHEAVIAE
jgi:hypothetical protein